MIENNAVWLVSSIILSDKVLNRLKLTGRAVVPDEKLDKLGWLVISLLTSGRTSYQHTHSNYRPYY